MANDLAFERTAEGLIVRLGDPPIPVGEWTRRADSSPGLGVLIRLRDDGDAFERDVRLVIPWRSVAALSSDELRITGLPDAAPGEEEQVFAGVVPTARQRDFAWRFRGFRGVKHGYAVGGGSYVVLTPDVEQALGAVRRAQAGTVDERRDFLEHPHGRLRAALDGDGDGEPPPLDDIFDNVRLSSVTGWSIVGRAP